MSAEDRYTGFDGEHASGHFPYCVRGFLSLGVKRGLSLWNVECGDARDVRCGLGRSHKVVLAVE